ncbi:MAG: GatB/YqeY domain-containing protein [bacterium]|nr:GatB/YqeY domain-containing protein [bacterium]
MLSEKIRSDLQQAQLKKEEMKVSTLRLLLSEISYAQISKGGELSDTEVETVVARELKKRREAASGFRQGGREEQAQKEEAEAKILAEYLPEQLSDEELQKIVDEAVASSGATSITEMGKVIGVVMGKVAGRAEGARVSVLVKERLGKG